MGTVANTQNIGAKNMLAQVAPTFLIGQLVYQSIKFVQFYVVILQSLLNYGIIIIKWIQLREGIELTICL